MPVKSVIRLDNFGTSTNAHDAWMKQRNNKPNLNPKRVRVVEFAFKAAINIILLKLLEVITGPVQAKPEPAAEAEQAKVAVERQAVEQFGPGEKH